MAVNFNVTLKELHEQKTQVCMNLVKIGKLTDSPSLELTEKLSLEN